MARRHARALIGSVLAGAAVLAAACSSSGAPGAAAGGTTTTAQAPPPSGSSSPSQSAVPPQSPVPAESNPPGDIPDNTVFVPYRSSAGGFTISVPEGWSRKTASSSADFVFDLNTIGLAWSPASSAPTVASAISTDVPALRSSTPAFQLQSVKQVSLPGGTAVLITYQANSKPNSVTGKQYRLVIERFEFFKAGNEAVLNLSSPVGADNVDPWRTVSESFTWQ